VIFQLIGFIVAAAVAYKCSSLSIWVILPDFTINRYRVWTVNNRTLKNKINVGYTVDIDGMMMMMMKIFWHEKIEKIFFGK
jgi:hypothetical protein